MFFSFILDIFATIEYVVIFIDDISNLQVGRFSTSGFYSLPTFYEKPLDVENNRIKTKRLWQKQNMMK